MEVLMGFWDFFKRKKKKETEPTAEDLAELQKSEEAAKEEPQTTTEETQKKAQKKVKKEKKSETKPESRQQENEEIEGEDIESEPTVEEIEAGPTGKFEIKKTQDGRYVFNLYASNHVIIATSQVYSSSQSAKGGINSVIANAAKAPIEDQTLKKFDTLPYPKWEIYLDKGGAYRFRLNASNGSCVCHSQGYTAKSNCKNGIASIIKTVQNAAIDKAYLATK